MFGFSHDGFLEVSVVGSSHPRDAAELKDELSRFQDECIHSRCSHVRSVTKSFSFKVITPASYLENVLALVKRYLQEWEVDLKVVEPIPWQIVGIPVEYRKRLLTAGIKYAHELPEDILGKASARPQDSRISY